MWGRGGRQILKIVLQKKRKKREIQWRSTVFSRAAGSYCLKSPLRDYSRSEVPLALRVHVQRRLSRLLCRQARASSTR